LERVGQKFFFPLETAARSELLPSLGSEPVFEEVGGATLHLVVGAGRALVLLLGRPVVRHHRTFAGFVHFVLEARRPEVLGSALASLRGLGLARAFLVQSLVLVLGEVVVESLSVVFVRTLLLVFQVL